MRSARGVADLVGHFSRVFADYAKGFPLCADETPEMDALSAVHGCPDSTSRRIEAVAQELGYLPSAPRILPKLRQLLCDANSPLRDIVMLIKLDAGIVSRVLHVANSIYYNKTGERCLAVDEAIGRVGYDQIYEMVSYAASSQLLARPLVVYGIEADELWNFSVAGALAAEAIAGAVGEDRGVAYTVGLLHCVGMVAIEEWAMHHQYSLTLASHGMPEEYTAGERAAMGFTQADIGAALLARWDFPPEMVDPVRYQYAPRECLSHGRMASILHVAKWVRGMACEDGGMPPLPDAGVLRLLEIESGQLVRMAGGIRLKLLTLRHLLESQ